MSDDLDAATTWARGLIARWPGEPVARYLTALVNAANGTPAIHRPNRDSDVAAWIKAYRDEHPTHTRQWTALDALLDDYRLHADVGQPLNEWVDEGGHEAAAYGSRPEESRADV